MRAFKLIWAVWAVIILALAVVADVVFRKGPTIDYYFKCEYE